MIERLEQALTRVIDGGIAAVFRLGVQPADIGRRLELAMLGSRRTSKGHVVGANVFKVGLHPEDFAPFASWNSALEMELANWLGEVAFSHGVAMLAPIQVEVKPDPAMNRRLIHIDAGFDAQPDARVIGKGPTARLIPVAQRAEVILLPHLDTTVGRSSTNDLVIDAADVSREHARLRRQGSSMEIRDLGSRNGTWVNGARISSHLAKSGDDIAFGTLHFRLELP